MSPLLPPHQLAEEPIPRSKYRSKYRPKYRLYVPQPIELNKAIALSKKQRHYLKHVLRLKLSHQPEIEIFNGTGEAYLATLTDLDQHSAHLLPLKRTAKNTAKAIRQKRQLNPQTLKSSIDTCPSAVPKLHLGMTLISPDRFDWVVQKSTELGVDSLTPINSAFSQGKHPSDKKILHWQAVGISACEQCRRNVLLNINPSINLELFIKSRHSHHQPHHQPHHQLIVLDSSGDNLHTLLKQLADSTLTANSVEYVLIIGPEGGWRDDELELFAKHHLPLWRLGEFTLRAETAAISAISLFQQHLGHLG